RIPAEHLEPGPRGARFHVVDFDGATGKLSPPARVATEQGDPYADAPTEVLLDDPGFRAQNVYAIAARTLATFEAALGRRLQWGYSGHQLFLVPRGIPEANAFYAAEHRAITFGHVPGGEQTALSYDIVAHETTHAILDGLRPSFVEPGLPDQAAFHEALADVVAMLSIFSLEEIVGHLLGEADANNRLAADALTPDALRRTALFTLAEQLGNPGERGSGLRRSIDLARTPEWRELREFEECHRRGEIVVAAVMQTLLTMWCKRLEALTSDEGADRDRVVEEGAKAAGHLLNMMVRGVDYLPPVELEFEDVVDAVLKADEIVSPDDPHRYRDALREAFAGFGVTRSERIVDLDRRDPREGVPVYERMNYTVLRSDRDEALRFIWENAHVFGIDRRWHTFVQHVRPALRVGPDGLIVSEVLAGYVQNLELTAQELGEQGVPSAKTIRPDTRVEVWGGGVIVFDQFGRAKLHQSKPLDDWERQDRRLEYLVDHGLRDRDGRYGFTLSTPRGQRFAALHVANDRAGEDW
ncbi:MAG TPA: hypothetical protein VHF89_00045, partial [Solirubrobacteraceae bacterium]|nr:hypothetical protein [Solirubrobacteraceae bacterium]